MNDISLDECVDMICRFPRIFKKVKNKTPIEIYDESNYEIHYQDISIEKLMDEIASDESIIYEWIIFSEDKRCVPAWAFYEKNGRWTVTFFQITPSYEFIFEDKKLACAHMIKVEMEQLRIRKR